MSNSAVAAWVDRYIAAWNSNDPQDIGRLFTADATYYTAPYREPWRGRDEIVREWIARKDEPQTFSFRYEVLVDGNDPGIVRGWTHYINPLRDYSNLWSIRLDGDGNCSEFIEWWMEQPKK